MLPADKKIFRLVRKLAQMRGWQVEAGACCPPSGGGAPPPPTGGRGKFGAEEGFYDDVSDESESENESDANEFPLANQRAQPKGSFASSIQSLANDFGTRANVQTPSGFYDS